MDNQARIEHRYKDHDGLTSADRETGNANGFKPFDFEAFWKDRFAYHPPTPEQAQIYAILRTDFTNLAIRIAKLTKSGPDQTEAIEQLHIAMMLANRAVALSR